MISTDDGDKIPTLNMIKFRACELQGGDDATRNTTSDGRNSSDVCLLEESKTAEETTGRICFFRDG